MPRQNNLIPGFSPPDEFRQKVFGLSHRDPHGKTFSVKQLLKYMDHKMVHLKPDSRRSTIFG